MDFATLKATVNENVTRRINLSQNQLGRVVNRALEFVVNHVEQTAKFYNMATAPITNSIVAGTTSYRQTTGSITIRKIIFAERTDTGGGAPVNVAIIDFRDKNRFSGGWPLEDIGANRLRPVVYFQRERDAAWYMRFPRDPGSSMTIDVYYVPHITILALDADEPTEVPYQHHDLIAMRATKIVLDQFGANSAAWDRNYLELLQMMQVDLETWNRTGPRVRQLHVNHV